MGVRALACCALGAAVVGCASEPRAAGVKAQTPVAAPISATVPDDFTLGVTIIPPTRGGPSGGQAGRGYGVGAGARAQGKGDVWARPARYIVEPDGTLRAALTPAGSGAGSPDGTPAALVPQELPQATVPPIVRVLSRQQLDDVYQAVRGAGFLIMPHGAAVSSAQTYAGRDRVIVLLSTSAQGRRQSIALSASDPGARAVTERLAALAWMDQP